MTAPTADEYAEACRPQGLPTDCGIDMFVRHHRANAGLAGFSEMYGLARWAGAHHDGFCRGCAYNHEALQGYGLDGDQSYAITTHAHELGIAAAKEQEPINTGFDRDVARELADLKDRHAELVSRVGEIRGSLSAAEIGAEMVHGMDGVTPQKAYLVGVQTVVGLAERQLTLALEANR